MIPIEVIAPGATIGILGGGQLGRMLAMAAARLGYRAHVYSPEASGPATEVAAGWTHGGWEDAAALARFAAAVDVATYEFENVPAATVAALAGKVPVRPDPAVLRVAQDRLAEKAFVAKLGGRTAPFQPIDAADQIAPALAMLGGRGILKARRMGYDGKGQARLGPGDDAAAGWGAIGGVPAVLEGLIDFAAEFSIILARAADGAVARWDAPDNRHRDGILDTSTLPPRAIISAQQAEAAALAGAIAAKLDHVGVLTCEFFATKDGPLFNEMAPRVHNSGHWTIEGAVTSQFENHIRAICGLPLGSTARRAERIEMRNLIGDAAADWPAILTDPAAHLHLYGKKEARAGRKMGHVTKVG